MLNELALRRPGFRPDVAVTLADGQQWHLPRPIVEFGMAFDAEGRPSFQRTSLGFGARHMELLQAFYDADGAEQYNHLGAMACGLLRLNYDLADGDLARLLPLRPGDEANMAMWGKMADLATGATGPKDAPEDDG